MISIGKLVNAEQVVRYLTEATTDAKIEYYTARAEAPGRWAGPAAQHLGLSGEVTGEKLRMLLDGRDPRSGAELMQRRWAQQSVVAFDVTFSAPKSVSLLWAVGDEQTRAAVLRAQQSAVDAVCEYLQAHAGWGRMYDRELGETVPVRAALALPQFLHRTSRPVTDRKTGVTTVDPQLHTHIPIPNFVLREDGSWGQLHSIPLYRHAASAGAVGQAVLRDELVRELAIAVEVSPNSTFEVKGINRAQRLEFSRRSRQVAAMDAAFDVDSWYGHKVAVLASREGKHEIPAGHDLFAEWRERANAVGLNGEVVASLLNRERSPTRGLDVVDIRDIVGDRGMTAEAATFTRRDLVRAVAAHAPLGMPLTDLERTVDAVLADRRQVVVLGALSDTAADELPASFRAYIDEDRRYSTPEMVAIEQRMLATAHAGRRAGLGLVTEEAVQRAIAAQPGLSGEQQTMIHAVCRRGELVRIVEGSAGSGKTYALAACRQALESAGDRVVGAALSAKAAYKLGEETGIPTTTVHSLLHRLHGKPEAINTVLVIDEAAMVGSRQIAQLVDYAERYQAKLVLVGDTRQLQPIDGGAAFRALGDHLGRVVMSENLRQADAWERRALGDLREGRVAEAVAAYMDHGAITAMRRTDGDLHIQVLGDYREVVGRGRDAVILAQRRTDVAFFNLMAHQQAAERGRLAGPSLTLGTQPAEMEGLRMHGPRDFRAGDIALCLQNDRQRGLTNGMRVQVVGVDSEAHSLTVRTPDNRELSIDVRYYDAIDHGYAMTVHKAQGLTADVALVFASGEEGREWTYTAMSRGREANRYYIASEPRSDDHAKVHGEESEEKLEKRLARSWSRSTGADSTLDYERADDRLVAHELVPHPQPHLSPAYTPDHDFDVSPSVSGPSPFG